MHDFFQFALEYPVSIGQGIDYLFSIKIAALGGDVFDDSLDDFKLRPWKADAHSLIFLLNDAMYAAKWPESGEKKPLLVAEVLLTEGVAYLLRILFCLDGVSA